MNFASSLREMRIQSATTIAIRSMIYLEKFAAKNGFGNRFSAECKRILAARPTAVVLHNAVDMVKSERSLGGIKKAISALENSKTSAAGNSSRIFRKKTAVLTHCHSSFVVASLVRNRKKISRVVVTETRPRDQGIITVKELVRNKIKLTYIIDSAVSDLMPKVDIAVVGADALRKEGLVNKVGTYPIALVAKEEKKPFYAITSSFAIDRRKKITIEQRPSSELGVNLKGASIENPAFDITPWKHVTGVVTEKGLFKPDALVKQI